MRHLTLAQQQQTKPLQKYLCQIFPLMTMMLRDKVLPLPLIVALLPKVVLLRIFLAFDLAKVCHYEHIMPASERDEAIKQGIAKHPKHFPADKSGNKFPVTLLRHTNKNGESYSYDYLLWSEELQSLFCFPCRLFSTSYSTAKTVLASPNGWSASCGPKWKKLYDRLPEHESSVSHRQCYLGVNQNEICAVS